MRSNILLIAATLLTATDFAVQYSWALSQNAPTCSSRRQVLFGAIGCCGWTLAPDNSAATTSFNTNLVAAKGAAELDLEFYIRDLMGGNAKQGNVDRSAAPPMPPPRAMQEPLLSMLLDDDVTTASCIPRQALSELVSDKKEDISQLTVALRDKVAPSFQKRAPWMTDHVSDQYYFDLTSYCLWRVVARVVPDYKTRDLFARNVGRKLYQQLKEGKLLTNNSRTGTLTDTSAAILEILNLFQSSNFCSSYRVTGNDGTTLASSKDAGKDSIIFDKVDSDDLASGSTLNFLVSVIEPATLGASLQITGEQSRFAPEFVGSTLAAMFEEYGISASYETYFVDQTYRPNPKDYFPNEQLLQFSLTKS